MAAVTMMCLECGQANRVPAEKLEAGPKCGTCGAELMDGKVRDLDPAGLAKATKADQVPLVVDFWAPWCGPCRMMTPELKKAAHTLAGQVRFARINTEDFPEVSQNYGVRGIPMLAAFRGGRELDRQAGAQPASGIMSWAIGAVTAKG